MNAEACADPGQRVSLLVEVDSVVDLLTVESAAAQGRATAVQVLGDGGAVDPQPGLKVVPADPCPVVIHQRRHIGGRESGNSGPETTDSTNVIAGRDIGR